MERFVRCRHCNMPHGASVLRCPITGGTIDPASQLGAVAPEVQDVFELCGKMLAGRFDVREVLGCGGMGAVYRAVDTDQDGPVAVKVLHKGLVANDKAVERFVREGDATQRLNHPRIVKHISAGTLEDESPYLVLEFLEGEPLADRLRVVDQLPFSEALMIADQLLEGLIAAHAEGVVHRDIKPDNLFLEKPAPGGPPVSLRILDFGISKMLGADSTAAAITIEGEVLGTPYYLAPEQIGRAGTVQGSADVWAVGVVLYEMVTGNKPFVSDNLADLLLRIATWDPPEPSVLRKDIDPALDAFILRLLNKVPEERFMSAEEARRALRELIR